MQIAESPAKIRLKGGCSAGTGPDLAGYPHLTHAPAQWGEGVRIASTGVPAQEVVDRFRGGSVYMPSVIEELNEAAEELHISWAEIFDALRYAKANGLI